VKKSHVKAAKALLSKSASEVTTVWRYTNLFIIIIIIIIIIINSWQENWNCLWKKCYDDDHSSHFRGAVPVVVKDYAKYESIG